MSDTETTAEWAKKQPQRSFIECADRLQDQDHSVDALADAMMVISLHMQSELHGARAVAARLRALADKFSSEADRRDQEARSAASH